MSAANLHATQLKSGHGRWAARALLDVALQHREQFAQLLPPFGGALRLLDAMVEVRVNQGFRQRLQPAAGGHELREDFRAVTVFIEHPLDAVELAHDFADTDDGSAAFLLGMMVMVFGHAGRIRSFRAPVKNGCRRMGYGGMCLHRCPPANPHPSMPDFLRALQNGSTSLWLFIPTAILLGALHGLEPGHSKTMMAAFIVAIRGTVGQAILLGLSAAISHSLIIWLLAALALHFGSQWNAETAEPYLQIGSAVCILALALWMFLRTRRELREAHDHHRAHSHAHGHSQDHGYHHHAHDERVLVPLGHGSAELSIFEKDSPPVFRLAFPDAPPAPGDITLETVRGDGARQTFAFAAKDGFIESTADIPEPHEFDARLTLSHGGHAHTASVRFREGEVPQVAGEDGEYQDAHERAHAADIAQRFAGRTVTTPQIILFGVTGGLMPCPAAFTVLLVCLQLKRAALGFVMVGAFSLGLALTMVATGVLAAIGVRHAQRRFRGFGEAMRRAPYVSCVLLVLLAAYMAWHGWRALPRG